MNILYISGLCTPSKIEKIFKATGKNPGFAVQKFNRLVVEGFVKNGNLVSTLSAPPIPPEMKGFLYRWKNENFQGVIYRYIPFINIKLLRQISLFIYTFFYVLIWGMKKGNNVVICDVLAVSINLAALFATKINRIKSVGILTDMPGLMKYGKGRSSIKLKLATILNKSYLSSYDFYVFLTLQMNKPVNKKHKPYVIMEGLVDSSTKCASLSCQTRKNQLVYAGGLFEEYGVRMLVRAFMRINKKEFSLHLFGDGPLVDWIKEQSSIDPRVIYHGVQSNEIVTEFERQSILLINPRLTHEEFTQYSFPSKNLEYMMSGTPVLTTRLPGMPEEYNDFVYLFNEESINDFSEVLYNILSKSQEELLAKGSDAYKWVLSKKNNINQTSRILEMINQSMCSRI